MYYGITITEVSPDEVELYLSFENDSFDLTDELHFTAASDIRDFLGRDAASVHINHHDDIRIKLQPGLLWANRQTEVVRHLKEVTLADHEFNGQLRAKQLAFT